MRRSIQTSLAMVSAICVMGAAVGCADKNKHPAAGPEAVILPGGFEARLAAARMIQNDTARDQELRQTALLSAKANYADVARGALKSMGSDSLRDETAPSVARRLD